VADGVVLAAEDAVVVWAAAVVFAREALSESRQFQEAHFCTLSCSVNFRPSRVRHDGLKQS
jgi:hypothetical protein